MREYFELILASSLWCCGWYIITQKGEALDFIRDTIEAKKKGKYILPEMVRKPLISCVVCMASVHTGIVYLMLWYHFNFVLSWLVYIPAAVSVSFLNAFLYMIYSACLTYKINNNGEHIN